VIYWLYHFLPYRRPCFLKFRTKSLTPKRQIFLSFLQQYGTLFSITAGYVTRQISKTKRPGVNYLLAFIIAGLAVFSLIKSDGNHQTQISVIALFAPVSILCGMFSKNGYN